MPMVKDLPSWQKSISLPLFSPAFFLFSWSCCYSVHPPNERPLIIISVYCPSGNNTSPQQINTLLSLIGDRGLIAGDFNAHHSLWEPHSVSNRCGNSILRSLSDLNYVCLNTPINLGTRMCPSSANISTIDLTFPLSLSLPLLKLLRARGHGIVTTAHSSSISR